MVQKYRSHPVLTAALRLLAAGSVFTGASLVTGQCLESSRCSTNICGCVRARRAVE